MPLQQLQFRPGVNREGTTLANEGGWFECDKIRFRSGYPEKLGGWVALSYNTFLGVCRSLWNWVTLGGYNLVGLGTNLKFYVENGGAYFDITPIRYTSTGVATFSTIVGSPIVTVTDPGSNTQANDFVTFSGAIALSQTTVAYFTEFGAIPGLAVIDFSGSLVTGWPDQSPVTLNTAGTLPTGLLPDTIYYLQFRSGLTYFLSLVPNGNLEVITNAGTGTQFAVYGPGISAAELNKEFQVLSAVGSQYTIDVGVAATPYDTGNGGGNVTAEYQLTTGQAIYTLGTGWSAGPWSRLGWGSGFTSGIGTQLRLWSQTNYGENLLFNPRGGPLCLWVVGAGQTPALSVRGGILSSASTGVYQTDVNCPVVVNTSMVSDASRIAIAFGCNDYGSSIMDPMLIRWSDQESYQTWTPAVTNQAGSFRVSHGSTIVTAIQTRQEILVWTDAAMYSMQYSGPPYVWNFTTLADNISIIGPNSVVTVNGITYWMGVDKFYTYAGRVETLPCTLRQYVYQNLNAAQGYQVYAGTNEGYNEVWWFYCSANSNQMDRYVIYNYLDKAWYYGTMGRTAWLDSPLRASPLAITYNNVMVFHETGTDNLETPTPQPIDSYIQSSDFDIGDGHNYGFVWRVIPDITFDGSTTAAPNHPSVNFTVRPRQNPGSAYGVADNPLVESAQSYAGQQTYNVQEFTQLVYTRVRGRQMAFKVASNTLGTQWQLGVPRIDVRPDGRR
jgi:hypothetical protein